MKTIDINTVIKLQEGLVDQFGGIKGVLNEALLESALVSPFQTFGGYELYPSVQEKVACTCYGIISNHVFKDGNKRVGILTMMTLLKLNGIELTCSDDELINLGYTIAQGKMDTRDITAWINNKTKENCR